MHFLRAVILRNLWRVDEGIISIRRALELDPELSDAWTSLGYALLEQGDLDAAMDALNRSIAGTPDPASHSNVLMTINYHPGLLAGRTAEDASALGDAQRSAVRR